MAQEPDTSYLSVASAELKRSIIAEWERTMLTASVKDLICAIGYSRRHITVRHMKVQFYTRRV
ncbi:hypothetical protein FKP32DRAFT_1670877 [Trametes sanguinea]|nr:hypothetical protein FKP32DRAFT_1670877 [Trametes sanguinea]